MLALLALSMALVLLGAGCGLLDDDESDSGDDGSTASTEIRVLQAAMGTQINERQQIAGNVQRAFPVDTNHVYAVLVFQGVGVGDEVTGRWYQLSTADAPPAGSLVSEAGVTLSEDNLTEDGAARVALDIGTSQNALPVGDWVLRVYVNDEFVRTLGFVITPLVASGAGSAEPTPVATAVTSPTEAAQPSPTAPVVDTPVPETYTVQSGDTLTLIAERFKTPEESVEAYVTRLAELNQLQPGSILFVGQVLQLPGPP